MVGSYRSCRLARRDRTQNAGGTGACYDFQVVKIVTTLVAALVVTAGAAQADDRDALQSKGEQLAKEGRYGDAIDAFKAADKIQPRASHACLIALAYTRRELWPQAELYLAICHERAKAGDPLPDWVSLADQQIRDRLATANVVEVAIEVKPATAQVTVSSFAPDEVFAPRTIHLPLGTHVIFAKAEGYEPAQTTLEITNKTPQHIELTLKPVATPIPGPVVEPRTTTTEKRGTPLLIAGGAAIGAGVLAHLWMGFEHGKLQDAHDNNDPDLYDAHSGRYDAARITTIGLYGAGAVCLGIGLYLRSTSREAPAVAALPLPEGGALVSIGWNR